jgi:signal transduction histidine kinase
MIIEIITSIFLSKVLIAMIDIVAVFLAYVVYRDNHKKLLNRFYVWMTVLMMMWVNFAYLPRLISEDYYELGLISLRIAWFASPLLVVSIYLLSIFLVKEENKFRIITMFSVMVGVVCSLLAGFGDTIISGYQVINGITTIIYGNLMLVFLGGIVFLTIMILLPIFTDKGVLKDRENLLFYAGVFIFLILNSIFNIILPVFLRDARFYFLGDYSTLILLGFVAVAIVRHQLFNIKVVVTEILSFFIWAAVLVQFITSTNLNQRLFSAGLFLYVLIFGIFLIRSVKKEIEQREKIEKIEKELQRAYEIEKKANEQLKALDETKNQFFMAIQHHLRTPLTSMRGYSDLLLEGSYGKMPKKVKEVVERFKISTVSLINMVKDFLDITQFQLGKKVVSPKEGVNLSNILKQIVDDIQLEADKKNIYLKLEKIENCLILADESKLQVALVNVIDNCVKYTEKGGVTIKLKVENDSVKIEVKDTGMGISKERLEKLFSSPFERTEQSKKSFATGRGIGLFLSQQIIKAHNGKLWAESEGEGKGSIFFIELPKN